MIKEYTFLVRILVVVTLPFFVYSTHPIGGALSWYTFTVPEEAVNPRLIGTYELISGLDIDVTVLDQEGCPTPENAFECISVYSVSNRDSGDVDVALTPGKTYYLEFHNPGFLVRGQLK